MRTFVLRARKGIINPNKIFSEVGANSHFEIIAHTLMNAFYVSNNIRTDVEVYIILESTPDFPRTLKFSSHQELSFPGFHEKAILDVVACALARGNKITKGSIQSVDCGIEIAGFGFDTLMQELQKQSPVYLLDKKGQDVRTMNFPADGVFILSDHLPMPKNSIKVLERKGLTKISLGRKMLFASQCVVLIHNELDRQGL